MKSNKNLVDNHKQKAPEEFIPTELGSATFASIDGRPSDREFLIYDDNSRDDIEDGAVNDRKKEQ